MYSESVVAWRCPPCSCFGAAAPDSGSTTVLVSVIPLWWPRPAVAAIALAPSAQLSAPPLFWYCLGRWPKTPQATTPPRRTSSGDPDQFLPRDDIPPGACLSLVEIPEAPTFGRNRQSLRRPAPWQTQTTRAAVFVSRFPNLNPDKSPRLQLPTRL